MWVLKRIVTGLDFKLSIVLTAIMFFLVNGSVVLPLLYFSSILFLLSIQWENYQVIQIK